MIVLLLFQILSPSLPPPVTVVYSMLVTQQCLTLCDPVDCSPPGSSVHGIFQQGYWSGLPFPSSGDLPDPGTELQSPALQADSLPAGLPGNTMCILWNKTMRNYAGVGNQIFGMEEGRSSIRSKRLSKNTVVLNLYCNCQSKL